MEGKGKCEKVQTKLTCRQWGNGEQHKDNYRVDNGEVGNSTRKINVSTMGKWEIVQGKLTCLQWGSGE